MFLLPSFTDEQRAALLAACTAVLYTPQNEHFGIVPLEAMASCRPVIACDSGGPTESVRHEITGFLCTPSPGAFAHAMQTLLVGQSALPSMHACTCLHNRELLMLLPACCLSLYVSAREGIIWRIAERIVEWFTPQEPGVADRMGQSARSHVEANFSRQVFGQRLVDILLNMKCQ